METLEPLSREVTAADYVLAALGIENAPLLLHALRADWMTPDEAAQLAPLACGVAYLTGLAVPRHRGAAA